ncbi:uncharacterized protein LOC144709127 [Wolffia australiana]
MGDLSRFVAPEVSSSSSSSSSKKASGGDHRVKPQRPKGVSWQEQRKIDRERKQREDDERTLAALETSIPSSNVGYKLLERMGYKAGLGRAQPVGLEIRRSRAGIGALTPQEEKIRIEREFLERKRRREEGLLQDFGSRQKTLWRSRRVVWDYQKAEAALAQLENREVLEPELDGEEEQKKEDEEEEESVTEEDLLNLLTKLRNEHHYCLYCGCKYESADALETSCPGITEDDH